MCLRKKTRVSIYFIGLFLKGVFFMQKKKEEELQREKELNELFKVAISQPKVPIGMLIELILF